MLRIENLDVLRSLKKLQLDNNALTKIEGLTAVPHLEWLDLSFNRIKKIEGIAHLTRLTDLSLYSNDISVVEGLDTLTALQYLSLGNNALANINTVLAFRSLPALEALTLEGNPLCKPVEGSRDSYSVWAAAFLPRLKYLDARLVTTADKAAARDGGVPAEKLAEVEEAAAAADKVARARAERAALVARLTDANLEAAATFPDELWEEPELAKLNAWGLPGLPPLMAALAEALKGPATDFMDLGGDKDRRIRCVSARGHYLIVLLVAWAVGVASLYCAAGARAGAAGTSARKRSIFPPIPPPPHPAGPFLSPPQRRAVPL